MSTSHARRPRVSLEAGLRHALVDLLKLKLPPGREPTLDDYEAATVHLLRELGPQLLEDAIQGVDSDAKKGGLLLGAADARPTLKATARARSPH